MPSKKPTRDDDKKMKRSAKPGQGSSESAKGRPVREKSSAVPRVLKKTRRQKSHRDVQDLEDVQAEIALRAHELYEERGRLHGNDLGDWLEAERRIFGEKSRA